MGRHNWTTGTIASDFLFFKNFRWKFFAGSRGSRQLYCQWRCPPRGTPNQKSLLKVSLTGAILHLCRPTAPTAAKYSTSRRMQVQYFACVAGNRGNRGHHHSPRFITQVVFEVR